MSLKIEITAHPDYGPSAPQLDDALAAIGFVRSVGMSPVLAAPYTGNAMTAEGDIYANVAMKLDANPESKPAGQTDAAPTRKRGEPSPGNKRRTKAEIAEDEAADAKPNISANPENRVDPAQDEADAEQDAADEAAEVEEKRDAKAPLTHDDVKSVMTAYVTRYGLPATQEDGPKIFTEALGKPPAGHDYWKLSLIPDDQVLLQKAVDTWAKAVELNPLKREKVL